MLLWQSGLIRSHRIVFSGRHNQLTEALLFPASIPPCRLPAVPRLVFSKQNSWSELSPLKPNRLRSCLRLPGKVISDRTGAYLASAAKACSNKITLRGHTWDRAGNDGSPWWGYGFLCPERSIMWKFPPPWASAGNRPGNLGPDLSLCCSVLQCVAVPHELSHK